MIPKDSRERIILGGTLLLTFFLSVFVFLAAGQHGYVLKERSGRYALEIATVAARQLSENGRVSEDPVALQRIVEEASHNEDVLFAIVADRDGNTLAANDSAKELFPPALFERTSLEILEHEQFLQQQSRLKTADGDDIDAVEVIVPVRIDGQFQQAVTIGLSLETTYAGLGTFRRRLTLLAVLGLIFGAVGFAVLVNSVLPSPPVQDPA